MSRQMSVQNVTWWRDQSSHCAAVTKHQPIRTAVVSSGQGQKDTQEHICHRPWALCSPHRFLFTGCSHSNSIFLFHFQVFQRSWGWKWQMEHSTSELLRILQQQHTVLGQLPTCLLGHLPFLPQEALYNTKAVAHTHTHTPHCPPLRPGVYPPQENGWMEGRSDWIH